MKRNRLLFIALSSLLFAAPAVASEPEATTETPTKTETKTPRKMKHNKTADGASDVRAGADNTATNKRDREASELTADQQGNGKSDVALTAQIRRSIMKDKSLSTYAHNVKIISQNGMVTLKGPVRSDEEKKSIETKASQIAGEGKVASELDVKPKS